MKSDEIKFLKRRKRKDDGSKKKDILQIIERKTAS